MKAALLKFVFSSAALMGDEEDVEVVAVLPVVLVTEDVSELTICVSMTGLLSVDVVAGTGVLPLAEVTIRLLS